jgi:hypothetical protein
MWLRFSFSHTRRYIVATHPQDVELLSERDTECIEGDHTIEVDSLGNLIVEGFFDEFLVLAEDFDIDHSLSGLRGYRWDYR